MYYPSRMQDMRNDLKRMSKQDFLEKYRGGNQVNAPIKDKSFGMWTPMLGFSRKVNYYRPEETQPAATSPSDDFEQNMREYEANVKKINQGRFSEMEMPASYAEWSKTHPFPSKRQYRPISLDVPVFAPAVSPVQQQVQPEQPAVRPTNVTVPDRPAMPPEYQNPPAAPPASPVIQMTNRKKISRNYFDPVAEVVPAAQPAVTPTDREREIAEWLGDYRYGTVQEDEERSLLNNTPKGWPTPRYSYQPSLRGNMPVFDPFVYNPVYPGVHLNRTYKPLEPHTFDDFFADPLD